MGNEYLRLHDTELNKQKAENALAIIENKRKDNDTKKDIQSENSLFTELFKAFKEFFANLGKPTIKKRIQKDGSPAFSKDYNDTMKEMSGDIDVAYKEERALSSVMVKNFNYSEAERQMLLNKVKKIGSRSVDYSFYSAGAKSSSLYGLDDFIDNTKIDFSKISPGAISAEVVTNQGVITLKRLGNENRAPLVHKVTGIQESLSEWNSAAETGGYEGLYFGTKNEPRPEGGKWHVSYSNDGSRLFENGASEEELMPRRLLMFDDNPDTFWEAEYVTGSVVGYKDKYSGEQITVAEFNDLVSNELTSPNVDVRGDTVVTGEYGSLIEDYVPVAGNAAYDYLNVTFDIHLDRAENLNWISLNPNNFGQEKYMEVLSIQTSSDGRSFEELEGFDDYEYDITLTQQANSELTPSVIKDTLSPDRFKFAGQGVWVFASRRVKIIRLNLRQTRGYPKTYEVLMVETSQTITTTTTTKKWWGLSKSTSTDSQNVKKQIEIPYLTGQISGFDVMDLEPGGVGVAQSTPFDLVGSIGGYVAGGLAFGPIGAVIGFLIGSLFGSSKKTETSVGAQTISRQWTKSKYDKTRFALGIRDINIYSYKFADTSELVSKPYNSPKPISKVALKVEEQIPKIFYDSDEFLSTGNDWIQYYISADEGASWRRISPMHHRSTNSGIGGYSVPEILNINSEIPEGERENPLAYIDTGVPVYSVRFKAVLSRPTDIIDAESYTPVLAKYALQIYPLGGL